jgi:glycosyltransferase involved in cell wall biosynthesis
VPRLLIAFKAPDGGAAENVIQLAGALGEHGWEVELAGPLEAAVYDRVPGSMRVHRLPIAPGYASVRKNVSAIRGLRAVIRRGRFDLLHAHSAQAGVLARLARLAGGPPVVYSAHGFTFINPNRLRSMVGLAIERCLVPLTAAFIDVSEYERTVALERGVGRGERHHLVYNACEPCPDVAVDAELAGFRRESPLMLLVSSLREQKRVDVFLRALPEVSRAVPEARAAVIGNGPESVALRSLADELGLTGERLLMAPFHGPAARYLRCADIYVLSSGWESLPIGILEALACGVPQVVADVGGVAEAVGPDTSVLVAPGDPRALSAALIGLLGDRARRERMALASRIRHRERFTLSRMVAETAGVYEAALASPAAS